MLIFKIALNWLKLLVCTLETKVNILGVFFDWSPNWSPNPFIIIRDWVTSWVTSQKKHPVPILLSIDISMCLANQTKNKLIFFLSPLLKLQ